MKKLNNQKGFAAFEGVLIVLVVVAIGAAGYFAYQTRQDKTDYSVNVPKTQPPAKDTRSGLTAGWKTYTSDAGKFSIKYPTSWVGADCSGDTNVGLFLAAKQDHLAVCNSDQVGQISILSLMGDKTSEYAPKGTSSIKTKNGSEGLVLRETNVSFMSPDYRLAVRKTYVFYKNSRTYVFTYVQDSNKGFPDNEKKFSALVEDTFVAN